MLDRLSWPVLIVAGVALVALAAILSVSVREASMPLHDISTPADIVKPYSPEVTETPAPAAANPQSPQTANPPAVAADHPHAMPAMPENLEARIRKRVHDELARVQQELLEAQKNALSEHEERRRDAEQTIKEAQQEFAEKHQEFDSAMREAEKDYAEKRREILAEMKDVQKQDKSADADADAKTSGCRIENGLLRCRFHSDKSASKAETADRLRELAQELRDAQKDFEDRRRDATKELHDAQAEAQHTIDEAHQEIATDVAVIGDSKTYKLPTIRIPEIKLPPIRIPDINLPAIVLSPPAAKPVPVAPGAPSAPVPGATPPAPAAPALAAGKATTPAPVVPWSKDTMAMVERDVGSAVADTVGQEVHTAVKGYRLVVGGMLLGIALLLFTGAVVGKTVLTSNRAARARADLLRVEAERNLMSRQVVEAQLKMMQAQVEPHFLFNTLANVRFLQESDPAGAGNMLDHLIEYLHAALPQMREGSTTLARETELARAYLEILRIRMGGRLDFAIQLPPELHDVSFPPMMLLSLVENAIKHGLEPMREGGRVDIEAAQVGGKLRLAVKDTGAGLNASAAAEAGSGVGLANIRARLKTLYGDGARLLLEENQPRGMIAAIEIPYVQANHSAAG
jgi:chemotaxis protein histidine kinase CheA